MTDKTKPTIRVMVFHRSGNTGHGFNAHGHRFEVSWYLSPEGFQEGYERHYSKYDTDRLILVDIRAACDLNPHRIIEAPLVDATLKPEETRPFVDPSKGKVDVGSASVLEAVAMFSPTIELAAARLLTDPTYKGLDNVSPEAYRDWWRGNGARIGTMVAGKIVWEE